jgi:hypothetical protein
LAARTESQFSVLVLTHPYGENVELGLDLELLFHRGRPLPAEPDRGRFANRSAVLRDDRNLAVPGGDRDQEISAFFHRFPRAFDRDRPAVHEDLQSGEGLLAPRRVAHLHGTPGYLRSVCWRGDGDHRGELLPHRDFGYLLPARLLVGLLQRHGLVQSLQYPIDDIRTIVRGAKPGGGKEVGGVVLTVIDVPA